MATNNKNWITAYILYSNRNLQFVCWILFTSQLLQIWKRCEIRRCCLKKIHTGKYLQTTFIKIAVAIIIIIIIIITTIYNTFINLKIKSAI